MGEKENLVSRRSFLAWVSAGAFSLMSGFAAFIGLGFLYPVKRQKPPALFVCLESEVPLVGEALEIRDLKGRKVFLMRKADGELMTIGTVCSHLGCTVFYRPKKKRFDCPCHDGVFDGEGNPVSGPPRRPLERYPTEVRESKVFVHFA